MKTNHPRPALHLNRRRFLSVLGTAAAAPLVVPSSVLGLDGAVAPSNRIVMANIGVGNRARAILAHFMQFKELQLRVVSDCRADRLKSAKEMVDQFYKNTECQTLADFRDVLARPDIDAVFIATGNRWHGLASILAAKSGKDVYSEKPISLTIAEGRELAETCKRLGTVYQAGHQRRSVDSYKFMAEVVRRGLIGKCHTVEMQVWEGPAIPIQKSTPVPAGVNYDQWLGQTPWREFNPAHFNAWQYFWDTAEGVITDMGCHYTDLMQFTLGTDDTGPVEFEGTAEFPNPKTTYSETPLRAEVRCRYANGIKAVMYQRAGFTDRYIRFIGDAGWVQVDDQTNVVTAEPKSILQLRPIVNKGWDDTGDHIGDWLHCMKTRTQPVANPETAHRAMSICQLFNLSLRLGQKLQWDPATEKFLNNPDAGRMLSRARRAPWTA